MTSNSMYKMHLLWHNVFFNVTSHLISVNICAILFLNPLIKGVMLQNPGLSDCRECFHCLGSLHSKQHRQVGTSTKKGSKICERWPQKNIKCYINALEPSVGQPSATPPKCQGCDVYNLIQIPSHPYLFLQPITRTRGHIQRYLVPHSRLILHQGSFFPSTIRLWNRLDASVVAANSIEDFKSRLQLTVA